MRSDNPLGEYFSREVSGRRTPPFPLRKTGEARRVRRRDDLFTLIAAAAALALIMAPGLYDNQLRKAHMSRERYEQIRESIPRLVYDTADYIQDRFIEES